MSNLDDLNKTLTDLGNLQESQLPIASQWAEMFGGLAGTIADLGGVVGFVPAIINAIDAIRGNDAASKEDINKLSQTIHDEFAMLFGSDRADKVLGELHANDVLISPAFDALDGLSTLITPGANLSIADRVEQIEKCDDALNVFDNDNEWMVNVGLQFYYSDTLNGEIGPPADERATGLVFSTRYRLLVFLRAISAFVTVGTVLLPGVGGLPAFATQYKDALRRYNQRLSWVYNRCCSGLQTVALPLPWQLWDFGDGDQTMWLKFSDGSIGGDWLKSSQTYGVVDRYGCAVATESYPPLAPPATFPPPDPDAFDNVFLMLRIANYRKYFDAYAMLGLPTVVAYSQMLSALVGDPPLLAVASPSFRQISALLGPAFLSELEINTAVIPRLAKLAGQPTTRPLSLRAAFKGVPGPSYQFSPGI